MSGVLIKTELTTRVTIFRQMTSGGHDFNDEWAIKRSRDFATLDFLWVGVVPRRKTDRDSRTPERAYWLCHSDARQVSDLPGMILLNVGL